ncbi:MAG: hypothetical protein AAF915_30145 [Cyanobacteria bacterium P01_D01_bin.50]
METPAISGLYEIVIGATADDESNQIQYWQQFGFNIGQSTSTTDKPLIRSGNLEVLRFEGSLPAEACLFSSWFVRSLFIYHEGQGYSVLSPAR